MPGNHHPHRLSLGGVNGYQRMIRLRMKRQQDGDAKLVFEPNPSVLIGCFIALALAIASQSSELSP